MAQEYLASPFAQELTKQLSADGYSQAAIGAALAHARAESGGRTNAVGDNSTSFGAFQWHGPRAQAFNSWARGQGLSPTDPGAQVGYFRHELNTTEGRAGKALRSATTPEAANEAMLGFERPAGWKGWGRDNSGTSQYGNRLNWTREFAGMVPGGGGPTQDAGTQPVMMGQNLPQTGADQGILMAALADQRQQGILNQARSGGGGSGGFLSSRQMAMDDGAGGFVKPIPVGMQFAGPGAVGAPVTNPGLGVGGANPTSLPSMALNPEALRVGNPSMPSVPGATGSSPALKSLSTQTDQPGNLMPSGANTPPALVLNRKEGMAAAAPTGVPLTPAEQRSATSVIGQGDGSSYPAAPPGVNPAAPPFAGGFFDRLQSSGIGDSLTRAGAALMARDNPSGAAALLGGLKEIRSRLVPGDIKQMQDGSFAREVTDRETGNVSMVPVSTTQVPQELLDAAKSRQLALSMAQQRETEHTEDRTLDRAYKEAKLQKLNGQDDKGAPDLTTPEGQQREREDALHAERYVGPMSSKMSRDERSRAVGYLARHGTSPEEVRQSQTKSTADLAGLREMAKVKDLAAISSGEAVSALDQTTKNVNAYYGIVADTGIPKANELKFAAARNGLLGEEASARAAAAEVSFNNLYSQIAQAANKTGNATLVELKRQMETYGPSMPKAMWEAASEVLGANVKGTQESRQGVYERQNAIDSGQKPPAAGGGEKKDGEKGSARRNFLINGQ